MLTFWLISGVFFIFSIGAIFYPVLSRKKVAVIDQQQLNVDIAREQLDQLKVSYDKNEVSDEEFESLKYELESTLMSDISGDKTETTSTDEASNSRVTKIILGILVLFIPLFSVFFYQAVGQPEMVEWTPEKAKPQHSASNNFDQALAGLVNRLKENPGDIDGWFLLARTMMSLEKYDQAYKVYEKLRKSQGDEPDILVSMADAKAMMQGGKVSGAPEALLKIVLEKDADNVTALWLSGIAAKEQLNTELALKHWRRLLPILENEGKTDAVATVKSMMAELGETFDQAAATSQASEADKQATDPTLFTISVEVDVDAQLKEQLSPELLVFVYAKAVTGPPMPLAVVRKTISDLPLQVTLNDSMAMMPAMKLSNFDEVLVGARVSMQGRPVKQSGDYMSNEQQVSKGNTSSVKLIINQKVP